MSGYSMYQAPFLRPAVGDPSAPDPTLPEGWQTHPAGAMRGDLMEVAFDPARHDLTFVWGRQAGRGLTDAISSHDWHPLAHTEDAQIWSRDRVERASRRLARLAHTGPSAGVER